MAKNMKVQPLEFEKPIEALEKMLEELTAHSKEHSMDLDVEVARLHQKIIETKKEIYSNLTPWQRVQIVRHPRRPFALDYLKLIASDYTELSGDRLFGNDRALIGGFATINGTKVMVLGQQKGRDTKENLMRNFGCAHPEGYRKALRLMRMADKFKLPIVCLIDTPGAYPGVASEERHVAEAIAVNIREMFRLRVPIVAVVLGEGGSGGALGIGIADKVLIMENAYYSVISPEGCAAILWKDAKQAPKAAEALKMTSPDLKELKLVDDVISEPPGGAHHDWEAAAESLKEALTTHLAALQKSDTDDLLDARYDKFRAFGVYSEPEAATA